MSRYTYRIRKKRNYGVKGNTGSGNSSIIEYSEHYFTAVNGVAKTNYGLDPDPRCEWQVLDVSSVSSSLDIDYGRTDNTGEPDPRGGSYTVGVTGKLVLVGKPAELIKGFIELDPLGSVMVVEVEVYDTVCEKYLPIMEVNQNGYEFGDIDDVGCYSTISLKEATSGWNCFAQTNVFDNHQHWFDEEPAHLADNDPIINGGEGPYHPRLGYCDEFKPLLLLVILAPMISLLLLLVLAINTIIDALNSLIPGSGNDINNIDFNLDDQLIGCGKVHHAPLIRTLAKNVCAKCGLIYQDAIFDTPIIHPLFVDEFDPLFGPDMPAGVNQYYNTALMTPIYSAGTTLGDKHKFWDAENNPVTITGYDLFNWLEKPFNSKWIIRGNKLIHNNKHFIKGNMVFDFTQPNQPEILNTIIYEFDTKKSPAFVKGVYNTADTSDKLSNDVGYIYNDVYEFNMGNSPQLEGYLDASSDKFGCTAFMNDSRKKQFFRSITTNPLLGFLVQTANDNQGMINLHDDTVEKYRLLIWGDYSGGDSSGGTFAQTRKGRVKNYFDIDNLSGATPSPAMIGVNREYQFYLNNNLPLVARYETKYFPDGGASDGFLVPNYPLTFDPSYVYNMAAWFKLDDPKTGLRRKRTFKLELAMCCEVMDAIRIWRSGGDDTYSGGGTTPYTQGDAYYNEIEIDGVLRMQNDLPVIVQKYTGYYLGKDFKIIGIQTEESKNLVTLNLIGI